MIVHLIKSVQKHFSKIPSKLIVAVTYLVLIALIYLAARYYVPVLVKQITKMTKSVIAFYQSDDVGWLMSQVHKYVSDKTISAQAKNSLAAITAALKGFGSVAMSFFMALVLSFFYTIELDDMNRFTRSFLKSDLCGWLFEDIYYFGYKFTNTFGVVLQAQFLIALCNTGLTMICLAIMGMPQVFALGLMVFICSLVPVAGGDYFAHPALYRGIFGRRDHRCDLHLDHDPGLAHPGNLYLEPQVHVQQDGTADFLHLRGAALR